MVDDLARALRDAGYNVENEYKIVTPGGFKPYRFADIAAFDAQSPDQPVEFIQVGRSTAGGFPVMRETLAMSDIWSAGEVPITFIPYNEER